MSPIPPPPVPQGLRDMLKDYPEHIQTLQDDLSETMAKPFGVTPLFEQAVWAIEGAISGFISHARKKLDSANASRDALAIQKAEREISLMRQASFKERWLGESDGLQAYCQEHKGLIS